MQVAAGGIVRQQTIFSGSIHRTQRSKRLMYAPSIVHRAQLAINRDYTQNWSKRANAWFRQLTEKQRLRDTKGIWPGQGLRVESYSAWPVGC